MHRYLLASMALAAVAGVAAAGEQSANEQAKKKVTVTGCVERADQVAARENLGTTVDSHTFVLLKAQEGPADASPRGGSASAAGNAAKAPGKMYRLDVDSDTMNPHVGHHVEIVGLVAATAGPPSPVGTSGGATAGESAGAGTVVLHVDSVKMLSSTCPRD